jgi:hypothetical protein
VFSIATLCSELADMPILPLARLEKWADLARKEIPEDLSIELDLGKIYEFSGQIGQSPRIRVRAIEPTDRAASEALKELTVAINDSEAKLALLRESRQPQSGSSAQK